jgi:HPt (histidine-containing phosphotransfer) domain-containing protein
MSGEDMGFVEEMIRQFEASTHEGLQEMEAAVEEGRFGTVRELAHKLASPARHLGLNLLLDLLKEIERKAPRGNKLALRELIRNTRERSVKAAQTLMEQFREMQQ